MAIKYRTVTRSSKDFLSEEEINEEARGGWYLVSHAAWAYDANDGVPKTYSINYVFAYDGGVGRRAVHGRGH